MSLTNHFDRFVAAKSQAITGVTASAGNGVPLLTDIPAYQQSLVTALPNNPPVLSASEGTRPILPSLFLAISDEDDNDSYEQSQLPYVPDAGNKTPSPLPMPMMDPSSDDDISDGSGADGNGVIMIPMWH